MAYRFWVPGQLPGENEIIKACRNRSYPRMKAQWTSTITLLVLAARLPKGLKRVRCLFEWVHPNRRHDPDNQEAAQKFIWDALTPPCNGKPGAGVIPNDGWEENAGSSHTHRLCMGRPGLMEKPGVWVTVVPVVPE